MHSLKVCDIAFICVALFLAVFSVWYAYGTASATNKTMLVIESPKGKWIYDMSRDVSVSIQGVEGDTTVLIQGQKASITDSPCLNKTCVAAHAISRPSQWIACLPNSVFIRIDGQQADDEIDIIGH